MASFSDRNTPSSSTGRSFPTYKGQARVQKNEEEQAAFAQDKNYYAKRTNPDKGRFGGKHTCKSARRPGKSFKNK